MTLQQMLQNRMLLSPDGVGGGDVTPQSPFSFSGQFYEITDPQTQQKIKVPNELKGIINVIQTMARQDATSKVEGKYKPIVEEAEKLKGQNEEIAKTLFELQEADKTAEQKANDRIENTLKEANLKVEAAVKEAEKWHVMFNQTRIMNDIYGSFGDVKLNNSAQTAKLFSDEGKARLDVILDSKGQPTNEFQTVVTLNLPDEAGKVVEVEGKPVDLFEKWVKQDGNLHHLTNSLKPGGGTQFNGKLRPGEDLSKLPPVERMNRARELGQA